MAFPQLSCLSCDAEYVLIMEVDVLSSHYKIISAVYNYKLCACLKVLREGAMI